MKVLHFPIHSQSTERAVQHVSKACMLVYGQEKRDGFVKRKLTLKFFSSYWKQETPYLDNVDIVVFVK